MITDESIATLLLLTIIFFVGSVFLSGFNATLTFWGKFQTKDFFEKINYKYYSFHYLLKKFFKNNEWDSLHSHISITKLIVRICYGTFGFIFAISLLPSHHQWKHYILIIICLILIILITDFFIRILATTTPKFTICLSSAISSIFLFIFFPLTTPLIKVLEIFFQKGHDKENKKHHFIAKDKVIDMLNDFGLTRLLDTYDQKIIASFVTFREKVAREIMVPRINLCSLSIDTTIRQAAAKLIEEEYSRIPVYRDTLDNILGVLMSKDVLKLYSLHDNDKDKDLLNMTLETFLKPVIYSPENKKISHLFQEFRSKQSHIAIIVNEYGGTEGIVTIEDILEELVGEIEDEYDVDEETQFWQLPNNSWVVDAQMSIIDLESKLNIHIPHNPEYETLGGYIFFHAGTIPQKGWKIHQDNYELEVLISNERCIEKIRITPHKDEKN
jgi:putative hemolysin